MKFTTKILILFLTLSYISTLTSTRFLKEELGETMPVPIDQKLGGSLITGELSLSADSDNYFYYTITEDQSTSSTYNVMTLFNSGKSLLNISCILEKGDSLTTAIKDKLGAYNKCKVFQTNKTEIINVLFDITEYKKDSSLKLWLNIKSNSDQKVTAYIRKKGSDLTDFKDNKASFGISEPYAYKVGIRDFGSEITTQNYYEAPYKDAIHIYGEKSDQTIELIDYTSIFAITDQTLAAHLHRYKTVYFFFGKNSATQNSLTVNYKSLDKKYPIYYHTNANGELEKAEVSFFSECKNNDEFYLLINNRDDNEPYVLINNLEGGKLYAKNSVLNNNAFSLDGEYTEINGAAKQETNDYHFDILKLQCGNLGQMNANIRYINKKVLEYFDAAEGEFTEFFVEYKKGEQYKLVMMQFINHMKVKIFTPENGVKKKFKITLEGTEYEIESEQTLFLDKKGKDTGSFRVQPVVNENINFIVSVSSFINMGKTPGLKTIGDKEKMYLYTLEQELNAGYGVELTLQNDDPSPREICYYAGEIVTTQFGSQNCKMVSGFGVINITKVLYKREGDIDPLHETSTYYIHLFNKNGGKDMSFYKVRILTDLEKSKPIDELENEVYTLQDSIEKNKDYYYSHSFKNRVGIASPEGHFDLYVINDTLDNINLDIQCILEKEIAIEYIKDSFTPENNKCVILNSKEKNKKVLHILFEQKDYPTKPDADIIIKIKSNKDTTIKFIDRKDIYNSVSDILNLVSKTNTVKLTNEDSSTIYSFNLTHLKDLVATSVVLYNKYVDSIKIFGKKNKNNYELIDIGSLLVISYSEYNYKYNDMETLYLVICQNTINPVRSNDYYLLTKIVSFVSYYTLPNGLPDGYTIQVKNQDCDKNNQKYIILNYAKPSKKEIYLSRKVYGGKLIESFYQDEFKVNSYEDSLKTLNDFHNITDNQQHASIIKFKCENNLNMRINYFYKNSVNNATAIPLTAGEAKYFFLDVGKIYTFSYSGIDEIKVDYLRGEGDKKITFEDEKAYIFEENTYLFYRKKKDKNSFTIENSSKRIDLVVRIATSYDIKKFQTTSIDNLYLNGTKYIYKAPKGIYFLKLNLSGNSKRLRLLANSGTKVCYYAEEILLNEDIDGTCFYMSSDNVFEYEVPTPLTKTPFYLIVYPASSDDKLLISKVVEQNTGKNGGKNGDEDGGTSTWVIVLIVILIIIVLVLIAFVVFRLIKKKSQVTSDDIDVKNEVKDQSPIVS